MIVWIGERYGERERRENLAPVDVSSPARIFSFPSYKPTQFVLETMSTPRPNPLMVPGLTKPRSFSSARER